MSTNNKDLLNFLKREQFLLTKQLEQLENEYSAKFLNSAIERLEYKIKEAEENEG